MSRIMAFIFSFIFVSISVASPVSLIFGDSLSDEGNVFSATHHLYPLQPYVDGRFSDGQVWPEYLNGTRVNYAYGGATSGYDNSLTAAYPVVKDTGLWGQVDHYLSSKNNLEQLTQANVYIFVGANDFLQMMGREMLKAEAQSSVDEIITRILIATERLELAGAGHIILMGLPDMSLTPAAKDLSYAQRLLVSNMTKRFNDGLSSHARRHQYSFFDTNKKLQQIIAKASQYEIKNVTDACHDPYKDTTCSNSGEYLFWDPIHPSAKTHRIFADIIQDEIHSASKSASAVAELNTVLP